MHLKNNKTIPEVINIIMESHNELHYSSYRNENWCVKIVTISCYTFKTIYAILDFETYVAEDTKRITRTWTENTFLLMLMVILHLMKWTIRSHHKWAREIISHSSYRREEMLLKRIEKLESVKLKYSICVNFLFNQFALTIPNRANITISDHDVSFLPNSIDSLIQHSQWKFHIETWMIAEHSVKV